MNKRFILKGMTLVFPPSVGKFDTCDVAKNATSI